MHGQSDPDQYQNHADPQQWTGADLIFTSDCRSVLGLRARYGFRSSSSRKFWPRFLLPRKAQVCIVDCSGRR
jgi:hypothetical protein